MQANAIRFCQIDSCRLGGVNEVLAVLLLAAKFGVPVCPHAGGVGLCEYVQHLSMFDYSASAARSRIASSSTSTICTSTSSIRCVIRDGRYMPPTAPGYSITMSPESLRDYAYPDGAAWADDAAAHGGRTSDRTRSPRRTMRAAVLVDVVAIEVRDVPVQPPAAHEVLVRVAAVGLCGTDLHIVAGHGNYNTDDRGRVLPLRTHPQILGHEIAGVVEEVGAGVVRRSASAIGSSSIRVAPA